jgi:hypothetical protein
MMFFVAFMLASHQPADDVIITGRWLVPGFKTETLDVACEVHVLNLRWRSDRNHRGLFERVVVDGQSVVNGVAQLQSRAAGRYVEDIDVLKCGIDESEPAFRVMMRFSLPETRRLNLREFEYFWIIRFDDVWRIRWDRGPPPSDHRNE